MMTNNEGVLEAARAIRPYLKDLVGPDATQELDDNLAALLAAAAAGEDVTADLRLLMDREEATAAFLQAVLDDAPEYRPPLMQPENLRGPGYQQLPGSTTVLHVDKYICPSGDYTWYRPAIGVAVRDCPTHGLPLERA